MVYRWVQELLEYYFSIIRRCDRMMRDVDAISRRFSPSIASYIRAAAVFTTLNQQRRPLSYTKTVPTSRSSAKYVLSHCLEPQVSVLTNPNIMNFKSHINITTTHAT